MTIPEKELDSFVLTALKAADEARKVTNRWFRSDFKTHSKSDNTPVTIADRETEEKIRDIILDHHPDHGFFGEETGSQSTQSSWQWVIDPIDGTKCFATGMPTFGTLISLLHEENPVLGVIDHPILNERWIGIKGHPTRYNDVSCTTSDVHQIKDASVYTTTMDMFDDISGARADKLTQNCQFRVFGGDCYGYGLVASGYNDLVCEADLKPYDFFALIPVVEGAGGVITDWDGNKLSMDSNGDVLAAANPELHARAIEILAG